MSFSSHLADDEIVINDDSPAELHDPNGNGTGLELGLRGPRDYEYGAAASPFPPKLLIPMSEMRARIEEQEALKTRLSDLIRYKKLPPKNQESTNYCWINAPTHCTEIIRLKQNQPMVILSPASAGAQIKGFRNVGGWGREGLLWIIEHGLTPVSLWPANAIDRRYLTPAATAAARDYRVTEWNELQPRNLQQLASMLLRGIPVAVGFNWWGHLVTAVDAVWLDGALAIRIRNSWLNWGDYGFGILQGSKALPDDAVAPRATLAT